MLRSDSGYPILPLRTPNLCVGSISKENSSVLYILLTLWPCEKSPLLQHLPWGGTLNSPRRMISPSLGNSQMFSLEIAVLKCLNRQSHSSGSVSNHKFSGWFQRFHTVRCCINQVSSPCHSFLALIFCT